MIRLYCAYHECVYCSEETGLCQRASEIIDDEFSVGECDEPGCLKRKKA